MTVIKQIMSQLSDDAIATLTVLPIPFSALPERGLQAPKFSFHLTLTSHKLGDVPRIRRRHALDRLYPATSLGVDHPNDGDPRN